MVAPSLLYGITDKDSVVLTVPIITHQNYYQLNSRGVQNTLIQFEHEIYKFENGYHDDTSSVFFGILTPTGSNTKLPNIGSEYPQFFLGATYNETYIKWLWFLSGGMLISPNHQLMNQGYQPINVKGGSLFTGSIGGGYNFYSIPDGMELFGLLEISGDYLEYNKINGQSDINSGGSFFNVTPSIWFSTKRLIFQLGISLPIDQHWNGFQDHFNYNLVANVAYTFYK